MTRGCAVAIQRFYRATKVALQVQERVVYKQLMQEVKRQTSAFDEEIDGLLEEISSMEQGANIEETGGLRSVFCF